MRAPLLALLALTLGGCGNNSRGGDSSPPLEEIRLSVMEQLPKLMNDQPRSEALQQMMFLIVREYERLGQKLDAQTLRKITRSLDREFELYCSDRCQLQTRK